MEGALDSGSAPGKAGSKSTPQGKKPPSGQGGGKQNKKSVWSSFVTHLVCADSRIFYKV
jgi:hypothetical protein